MTIKPSEPCDHVLSMVVEIVVGQLDKGQACIGIFMDLAKAVEKAKGPNEILSMKVHTYNVYVAEPSDFEREELGRASTIRYLGVTLDEKLTFVANITIMCGRIRKLILTMKLLREATSKQLIINVYEILRQTVLTYCISVWVGADYAIHTVLKVHNELF
ncbi:hypothetical protein EVAR_57079_1 [Eumeta japonica]|uniref:Uncharacterized protein n=1 Tax=Eumeta variegata TaxID=151549 RepID=A0A4C1Y999_EUMVA|nr:hypothetical protein EVAR_57079_1 [Eumeta japonica]